MITELMFLIFKYQHCAFVRLNLTKSSNKQSINNMTHKYSILKQYTAAAGTQHISIHSMGYLVKEFPKENMECSIFIQSLFSRSPVPLCLPHIQTINLIDCYHGLPDGVTAFFNIATFYLVPCSQQLCVKGCKCLLLFNSRGEKSFLANSMPAEH